MSQANYDQELIEYTKSHLDKYQKQYDKPYHLDMFNNPLSKDSPQDRFFETLYELVELKKFYDLKGIPSKIFNDSIYDFNHRVTRYYNKHHAYGLETSDLYWLGFLFRGEIFDIGSLRFQRFSLTYAEIERSGDEHMILNDEYKELFPEGTPIVNIHILQGANISPVKIDESLATARDFFSRYFKEHQFEYFFCRSWMVYPGMLELLNPDSNISQFIHRFKVIASHDNPNQALKRIYGTTDIEAIKKLDHSSSLAQKAYLNLDKLGVALGIIKR